VTFFSILMINALLVYTDIVTGILGIIATIIMIMSLKRAVMENNIIRSSVTSKFEDMQVSSKRKAAPKKEPLDIDAKTVPSAQVSMEASLEREKNVDPLGTSIDDTDLSVTMKRVIAATNGTGVEDVNTHRDGMNFETVYDTTFSLPCGKDGFNGMARCEGDEPPIDINKLVTKTQLISAQNNVFEKNNLEVYKKDMPNYINGQGVYVR